MRFLFLMSRKCRGVLVGCCVIILLITGCSSEEESIPQQEPPLFQRKPPPKQEEAEVSAEKDNLLYTYDPDGRRDPFKSLIEPKKKVVKEEEELVEIISPLQEYDLSSLTLVGIVWGELGKRAIIRTPDGKGYTVIENVPIGKGRSRVVQINSDNVVIEVLSRDDQGNPIKETVVMELRKKEG